MATYEYRCPQDGSFDVTFPIGTAGPSMRCPRCGAPAGRMFSAPRLGRLPAALREAIDRAERSAERPDVVERVPGRRPARRSSNAAHARLPRW